MAKRAQHPLIGTIIHSINPQCNNSEERIIHVNKRTITTYRLNVFGLPIISHWLIETGQYVDVRGNIVLKKYGHITDSDVLIVKGAVKCLTQ